MRLRIRHHFDHAYRITARLASNVFPCANTSGAIERCDHRKVSCPRGNVNNDSFLRGKRSYPTTVRVQRLDTRYADVPSKSNGAGRPETRGLRANELAGRREILVFGDDFHRPRRASTCDHLKGRQCRITRLCDNSSIGSLPVRRWFRPRGLRTATCLISVPGISDMAYSLSPSSPLISSSVSFPPCFTDAIFPQVRMPKSRAVAKSRQPSLLTMRGFHRREHRFKKFPFGRDPMRPCERDPCGILLHLLGLRLRERNSGSLGRRVGTKRTDAPHEPLPPIDRIRHDRPPREFF